MLSQEQLDVLEEEGTAIITGSFPLMCKVHSLSFLNMLTKMSTSFNCQGAPHTGAWTHSKIL